MLGDRIRQHRELSCMSQEELAKKLGVPCQSVFLWENNHVQPTIENIVALSKVLYVSTDDLLAPEQDAPSVDNNTPIFIPHPNAAPANPSLRTTYSEYHTYPDRNNVIPPQTTKKKMHVGIAIFIGVIIVALLGACAIAVLSHLGKGKDLTAEEIYTKISPSVVEVVAESATSTSTGTGFFYDTKGTVITNYHVIDGCQSAEITLADGATYKVKGVIGYDKDKDIAILSTNCKTSIPLPIRNNPAKTGETVYALGSSLGLTGSLSNGIVSAADREMGGNVYIQTTAPISHGNSGGPLVDAEGYVIGIVCGFFADGQNLNLAIPIDEVRKISLNKLITLEELFPMSEPRVEWVSDWRFEYYAAENTYVLLFQLSDENEIPLSADGTVEITIINNDWRTVYSEVHHFTEADFEEWIYDDTNEMYLATIYISPQSIAVGATEHGFVYFEVYGDGYAFEECSIEVFCLPTPTNGIVPPTVGVRTISFADKAIAESVLAEWESGEKTEASMIALMDKYGAQQGGGQLYTISPGQFVSEIDNWCFAAECKVGDYAIIENAYGYSLCYISSIF